MVIKNALEWLFSDQSISSQESFELFITKFSYLINRIFLKIFKPKMLSENLKCYLPHSMVVKNKHGFKANVNDGYSLIMFTRDHEPYVLKQIKLEKNSVFLDIGSSLGFYTLFAANKCKNGLIISIEPDKNLYEKLKKNVELNKFGNVKCINCAICNVNNSSIKLYKGVNPTIIGNSENYSIVVGKTLDSIISENQISQIDWIKIDIESAELMALEGATKTLQLTKNLILEIHSKKNGQECLKILKNHGFNIELIKKSEDKHETPFEILQQMEDKKGNIRYFPLVIARK